MSRITLNHALQQANEAIGINSAQFGHDTRLESIRLFQKLWKDREGDLAQIFSGLTGAFSGHVSLMLRRCHSQIDEICQELANLAKPFTPIQSSQFGWTFRETHAGGVMIVKSSWSHLAVSVASPIIAAIGLGCPVVCAIDPNTLELIYLFRSMMKESGIPESWFIPVEMTESELKKIATHPSVCRVIVIGESRLFGKGFGQMPPESLVQTYLTQSSGMILLADADIDRSIDAIINGMTFLNGRWVNGPQTIWVPKPLVSDFEKRLFNSWNQIEGHQTNPIGSEIVLGMSPFPEWLVNALQSVPIGEPIRILSTDPKSTKRLLRNRVPELDEPVLLIRKYQSSRQLVEQVKQINPQLLTIMGNNETKAYQFGKRFASPMISINGHPIQLGINGLSNWKYENNWEHWKRLFCRQRLIGFRR